MREEQQQFFEIISKSQKPLLVLAKNPSGDALGSALALYNFLKKLGKAAAIICDRPIFANYDFLPNISAVKPAPALERDFVVEVDTSKVKLDEISYHSEGSKAKIYLKPSGGAFKPEDISFGSGSPDYDLIICAGTPSLEYLGEAYTKNTDLFFNTTKICIDNHIGNENYANLNIVDITSASTSEIVMALLKQYAEQSGEQQMDSETATCLLAGIISETNCFQSNKTTPNSFARASELVNMGASQQEIVRRLFRTKSMPMLKLLGRAMSKIKQLSDAGIYFTAISAADMEKSGANEDEIFAAAEFLAADIAEAKMVFFILERESGMLVYIYTIPNIKLSEIINYFGGERISDSMGKIIVKQPFANAENFVNEILDKMKIRLGLA